MLCSVLPAATHMHWPADVVWVSILWVQQIPVLRSLSKPFLLKALIRSTTYSFLAADVSTGVCTKFALTVLWMVVYGCGCQVFVPTGSWQLPRPWILDVGREERSTCCSARERQEMLFMNFFHCLSLSFFVCISWKWQVKRLKWIVFVDDLSRKAIAYDCMSFDSWNNTWTGFYALHFVAPLQMVGASELWIH